MLWHNVKAEIKIVKLDNGYVVEWSRQLDPGVRRRNRQMGLDDDDTIMGERRGMEIMATEAALLKRLKELV